MSKNSANSLLLLIQIFCKYMDWFFWKCKKWLNRSV